MDTEKIEPGTRDAETSSTEKRKTKQEIMQKKHTRWFVIVGILFAAAAAVCVYAADRNRYDFEKSFFQVVDQYDTRSYTMKELHEIYAQEHFLDRLVEFNRELNKQQEEFQFVELGVQPIELVGHWDKPERLANGYGHKDLRNQKVEFEGEQIELTPVDGFQIAKQSQALLFGRELLPEEAFVQNKDIVPLVLGYDFQQYYKVGDTIPFLYLDKRWTGKVAGFLNKEEKIKMDEFNVYPLDCAMVMPFFDEIDQDAGAYYDRKFWTQYLCMKNWGFLKLKRKEDYKEGKRYIEKLAEKYSLDYTLLRGY